MTVHPYISTGLDRGVVYFRSYPPAAWSGLSKVEEKGETESYVSYFDGQMFVQQRSADPFAGSIEAYSYPENLDNHDIFDLTYRVTLETGYEIHLVYNVTAVLQQVYRPSVNSSADLDPFGWDFSTIPVEFNLIRAASHFVINSNYADSRALGTIESMLYGTTTSDPVMPEISEILGIFDPYCVFVVTDNGDGTWTATGPDSWFNSVDATTVEITTQSVDYVDDERYIIRSW